MVTINTDKCSVFSVGRNNPQNIYTPNKRVLHKYNYNRDLSMGVRFDLRLKNCCITARNRTNRVSGFISPSVNNRSVEVIHKLYLALVMSPLDYGDQSGCSFYSKDIDFLKLVQKRMTKMIQRLKYLPFKKILKKIN